MIDVRAFGATGDGDTDDVEALQSAIDSLPRLSSMTEQAQGGGSLYLPAGRYRISSPLRVAADQAPRIVGDGPAASQIVGAGIVARSLLGFRIDGLAFHGTGHGIGLDLGADADWHHARLRYDVRDVQVEGFDDGLVSTFCQRSRWDSIYAARCRRGIVARSATVGTWTGCQARECDQGVVAEPFADCTPRLHWLGGIIESNREGLSIDSCPDAVIDSPYMENNRGGHIVLRQTDGKRRAVCNHVYRSVKIVSGQPEPLALRADRGEGYQGGEYRLISIVDPSSTNARWDLSGIARSIVVAPFGTDVGNAGRSTIVRYGSHLGEGTVGAGPWRWE